MHQAALRLKSSINVRLERKQKKKKIGLRNYGHVTGIKISKGKYSTSFFVLGTETLKSPVLFYY